MSALAEGRARFTVYGILRYRGVAKSYETGFVAVYNIVAGRWERPKVAAYSYQT
jgi:hypothetical protein